MEVGGVHGAELTTHGGGGGVPLASATTSPGVCVCVCVCVCWGPEQLLLWG